MSFYNRVYVCSSVVCRDERERPPARSQDIQFPFQPSLELEIVISATLYPRVTSRVSTLTLCCTLGRGVRGCWVAFWRGQVWPGPAIMAGRTCHARQRTYRVLIVLGPGKAQGLCGMARPPRINYNMIYVYKIIFVPVSIQQRTGGGCNTGEKQEVSGNCCVQDVPVRQAGSASASRYFLPAPPRLIPAIFSPSSHFYEFIEIQYISNLLSH